MQRGFLAMAILVGACAGPGPSDDKEDTAPTDVSTDEPVETDETDLPGDTDPDPTVRLPTRLGASGGGGAVDGATHRARLVVGDPLSVHAVRGTRFRARLGLGTTQILEQP